MNNQMIQNHLKYAVKSLIDERLKKEGPINDGKDCLTDDQIHAYAAHQLSHEERKDVINHISSCMPCFIKNEQYYYNYQQQEDLADVKRQFNILGGIAPICYKNRANDLHSKVLLLTSDLTIDQCNEHPAIVSVDKQEYKTDFTNIPVASDDKIDLSIAITNKQIVFRHNINIPLEIIYEKEIVPLKISKKRDEVFETQFDFTQLTDGNFYIYPQIIEQKVLSVFILKLQEATSTEQSRTEEKQTEQINQPIDIIERIKSVVAISVFIKIWKSHKRIMVCMIMLLLFSYFSYDSVNHYFQPSITTKQIVSLPWEIETSLAADTSRRSFPRYMAFAAGLWNKRSQLFPGSSHKMPECLLPANDSSEKNLDQWKQFKQFGVYYQLGMACLNIYAKKETNQALPVSFIKEQIFVFKNIQNDFFNHANKNDIEFVDKRLLQIISILSNIHDVPLKRERNDLYDNIYSIIHHLSPHYALK